MSNFEIKGEYALNKENKSLFDLSLETLDDETNPSKLYTPIVKQPKTGKTHLCGYLIAYCIMKKRAGQNVLVVVKTPQNRRSLRGLVMKIFNSMNLPVTTDLVPIGAEYIPRVTIVTERELDQTFKPDIDYKISIVDEPYAMNAMLIGKKVASIKTMQRMILIGTPLPTNDKSKI